MPLCREYERMVESDMADVRNTSKDGCGAITAGAFLKRFTQDLPWLHLDIAGTASVNKPVWQHQVSGRGWRRIKNLYLQPGDEGLVEAGAGLFFANYYLLYINYWA